MAGRGAGGQGHRIRAHHGSSAGGQRSAGRARYRFRSTNAAAMADRRAGRLAQGQRGRGVPSPARLQRPQRRGGHRAARPAQRGRREGAGQGPPSQEAASPSAAPVSAPAVRPAPGARRPSWGSRTPGGAAGRRALPGPQLSAITPGSQGRGRAAEHLLESQTPGLGVAPAHTPPASNPSFRASGSEARAGSSGFRRSPPESRPSLTVTRATVGVAAASRTGRG